ncbi:hypothetical protein ACHAXS_011978 [Conticribra weissflogii]
MTDDSRPNFFHIGGHDSGMHPSGLAWPPALRRKLGLDSLPPKCSSSSSSSSSVSSEAPIVEPSIDPFQSDPIAASQPTASNRSFTAEQLRKYIHQSYAALSSIQRQLHRGEESYFEETYNHGNIFAGFDNIWIDAGNSNSTGGNSSAGDTAAVGGVGGGPSGVGGGADAVGGGGGNTGGSSSSKSVPARKMPGDHRWFSTSCGSVVATGDGRIAALDRWSLLDHPPPAPMAGARAGTAASKGTVKEAKVKVASPEPVLKSAKKAPSTQPKNEIAPNAATPKPSAVPSDAAVPVISSVASEATIPVAKKQSTTESKPAASSTDAATLAKKSTPAVPSSLATSPTMSAPIPRKSSSSSSASTGSAAPASKDSNLMAGAIPRKRPAVPVVVPSATNHGMLSSSKTANVPEATTSSADQGKKKPGKKRKNA